MMRYRVFYLLCRMKKRIEELDFLKSLFIVLMVIFHLSYIGQKYPFAKSVVYTFHMPAFLLISGYLLNVSKSPRAFFRGMLWIFIPYAVMEVGYACVSTLIPVWDGLKEVNAAILLGKIFLHPIGPYWYLHTLMLCSCVCYATMRYVRAGLGTQIAVAGTVLMCLAYVPLCTETPFHKGVSLFSGLQSGESIASFFSAPSGMLSFPNAVYFLAGFALNQSKHSFTDCFPRSAWVIPPLILLCGQPENLNRATLAGALITVAVCSFALWVYRYLHDPLRKQLLFIGRNTLPILLFSPIFTALSKVILPFLRFDPTGMLFLFIATGTALYGSIGIARLTDALDISRFFFGKERVIN